MNVPKIDSDMGIDVYSSDSKGTGGTIKESPEDFLVSEVISDRAHASITDEPGHAVFLLKKQKIDTTHALLSIRKHTGLRLKALGLKDASAITEQYVYSTKKITGAKAFSTSRYSIEPVGYCPKPLSKKEMIGNRFRVRVTGAAGDIGSFDQYERVLNFYGYQRFGSRRPVTHLVGRAIIRGDWDSAAEYLLWHTSEYDSEKNNEIRKEMNGTDDYAGILKRLPPQMDLERIVVSELAEHGDRRRAVAALPVQIKRFYMQAYQSYLFNRTISAAFQMGEDLFEPEDGDVCFDDSGKLGKFGAAEVQRLAVPQVGFGYYNKTRFNYYIKRILADEEIRAADFYIKDLPEASAEAGFRNASIRVSEYAASGDTVSFVLSRGSYATILLREILKPQDPLGAGF